MKKVTPFKHVIAERELQITGTDERVRISVGVPQQLGGGWDWVCPYAVQGLGEPIYGKSHGIDALQALQLVSSAIRITLRDAGQPLTFLDSDWELGFPEYIADVGDLELRQRLLVLIEKEQAKWFAEKKAKTSKK